MADERATDRLRALEAALRSIQEADERRARTAMRMPDGSMLGNFCHAALAVRAASSVPHASKSQMSARQGWQSAIDSVLAVLDCVEKLLTDSYGKSARYTLPQIAEAVRQLKPSPEVVRADPPVVSPTPRVSFPQYSHVSVPHPTEPAVTHIQLCTASGTVLDMIDLDSPTPQGVQP